MVLSKEKAAAKYLAAIKALGGASAYYACGEKVSTGGVKAVAECMKGLKKKVSEEVWAQKYAFAYELLETKSA
jgi:hypothetical protein